jgi:uncharacterized protein YodC (DUF2158 family)
MATKFSKGQVVKLNVTTPSGEVQKLRMTEDGVVEYMISWTDANGSVQERWFEENQLTEA